MMLVVIAILTHINMRQSGKILGGHSLCCPQPNYWGTCSSVPPVSAPMRLTHQQDIYNQNKHTNTHTYTLVYRSVFQYSLGKPLPEWQTILDFVAATDDGGCNGDNCNS